MAPTYWHLRRLRPHYGALIEAVEWAVLDRRAGIRTSGIEPLERLGVAAPERVPYEPSGWLTLPRILRPGEIGPDDVFLELGSGKGRVLVQAARYPFRRLIGVDVSGSLNELAQENVTRALGARAADVEIVTADFTEFEIPDAVTYAYFYNSVRGAALDALIDKVRATLVRAPRPLRFIYRNAEHEQVLLRSGLVRRVRLARAPLRRWLPWERIALYELGPPR